MTPQVEQLARVLAEVEVRLEPVSGQIAELDATIGDGSAWVCQWVSKQVALEHGSA